MNLQRKSFNMWNAIKKKTVLYSRTSIEIWVCCKNERKIKIWFGTIKKMYTLYIQAIIWHIIMFVIYGWLNLVIVCFNVYHMSLKQFSRRIMFVMRWLLWIRWMDTNNFCFFVNSLQIVEVIRGISELHM